MAENAVMMIIIIIIVIIINGVATLQKTHSIPIIKKAAEY
jgi:hypothetical protein